MEMYGGFVTTAQYCFMLSHITKPCFNLNEIYFALLNSNYHSAKFCKEAVQKGNLNRLACNNIPYLLYYLFFFQFVQINTHCQIKMTSIHLPHRFWEWVKGRSDLIRY